MPTDLPVDMLSRPLSEIVFRRKNNALFKKLARKTHFNLREVEGYTARQIYFGVIYIYIFSLT